MKIDWLKYENEEHVLSWFILEAMSKIGIDKFGDFDSSSLDVELKINGLEVPIVEPMEFLQSQLKDIEAGGKKKGIEQAEYLIRDNIERLLNRDEFQ